MRYRRVRQPQTRPPLARLSQCPLAMSPRELDATGPLASIVESPFARCLRAAFDNSRDMTIARRLNGSRSAINLQRVSSVTFPNQTLGLPLSPLKRYAVFAIEIPLYLWKIYEPRRSILRRFSAHSIFIYEDRAISHRSILRSNTYESESACCPGSRFEE